MLSNHSNDFISNKNWFKFPEKRILDASPKFCNFIIDEFIEHKKTIIFYFDIGFGGLGDYLKYFIYAFNFCIENNLNFYFLDKQPIKKYIKLKYENFLIEDYDNDKTLIIDNIDTLTNDFLLNDKFKYYLLHPKSMYHKNSYQICNKYVLNNFFEYSNDVLGRVNEIINNDNYISIHLRLGDKFLETDKQFIVCKNDERAFDENKLINFINENKNKSMYFFCDNNSYRQKIKKMFNFIKITDLEIAHTSLSNTSDKQIFDCVVEFCILSNSKQIYINSCSGFPIIASRFNDVQLINI